MQDRYQSQSNGAAFTAHGLYRDSGDSAHSVHLYANLFDFSGGSNKVWWFQMNPSTYATLPTKYEERNYPSGLVLSRQEFTWATQATSQNPYIGNTVTTLDPGQSYQQQKKTTQTIDQYGNLTQMQVSPFNDLGTVLRTYTNTYLNSQPYGLRYIFNRLLTSTVDSGGKTGYLATNTYDTGSIVNITGMMEHDAAYDTNFAYRGNVTSSTTPADVKTMVYDIGGNVTSATVNGLTTSVVTDSGSNYAAPCQMTVNSMSVNMNWNAALAPTQKTGPNGDTALIGYGSNGRPASSTSPNGASTTYTYKDTYSPTPPTKTATTNGHWVRTTMDGFGRTIKTEAGSGDPNGTATSAVSIEYAPCGCSPLGKLKRQSQPYAGSGSPQCWTTYTYDGSGRTLTVVTADGASTTTYVYQGNTVNVTDPAGKWKQFRVDPFGNLVMVVEPNPALMPAPALPSATRTLTQLLTDTNNGTPPVNLYFVTSYTYDILNHLTGVSMPRPGVTNPQTRTFNYTSGSTVGTLLLSAINPENGTVSYTYNSDMTLHTKTDANGQVFTYSYDDYKRPWQISVGANVLRTFTYGTDAANFTKGRLITIQNTRLSASVDVTEAFTYTQPGHVSRKSMTLGEDVDDGHGNLITVSGTLSADYQYDNEGKMTSVAYPNGGSTYTYSFDALHRLTGLAEGGTPVVSGIQYGPASELTNITYFGFAETRQYNSMLQLTSLNGITYTFPAAGSNNGKITSQVISGETITYQYDSLNRLASAAGSGWSQTFGYDGFGNLVSKVGNNAPALSVAVDASTNHIVGQSYDSNGNQGTAAMYDAENRLTNPQWGLSYAYDSQNKRVWKGTYNVEGFLSQEAYFYGVDGRKLGTYAVAASRYAGVTFSTTEQAVYFGPKRVGTKNNFGVTTAFVPDRQGSIGKYFPYGEERNNPPLADDQVKFATYTRDSATGLDYADQRYYASNFGRFRTPDPAWTSVNPRNPGTWNRYSYVNGDPANWADPTGLVSDGGDIDSPVEHACLVYAPAGYVTAEYRTPACLVYSPFLLAAGQLIADAKQALAESSIQRQLDYRGLPTSGFLYDMESNTVELALSASLLQGAGLLPVAAGVGVIILEGSNPVGWVILGGTVVIVAGYYILPKLLEAIDNSLSTYYKADIKQVTDAARQVSKEPGCRPPRPDDYNRVHDIIKDQKGPDGKVPYDVLLDAWREVLCP